MRTTQSMRKDRPRRQRTPDEAHDAQGVVFSYPRGGGENLASHEAVTRRGIARKLAVLKGYEYGGDYDAGGMPRGAVYFVPGDTIVGLDAAHALGIHSEKDLFGGVVPHAFVATKTITHPLVDARATAPEGWSPAFAEAVGGAVLPGYSAFTKSDARSAAERLLGRGPVRMKPALAIGGRGQVVAHDLAAVEAAVAAIDASELATCGIVLEHNLSEVTTFSVGQVHVADLVATYVGTQKLATDSHGTEVYGGSALLVARGDFEDLLKLDVGVDMRLAVEQARTYDRAARQCFTGFFASRRNYDIARGRDAAGAAVCGVLEQSWRPGGASGAEVAALEAFRADALVRAVRAECSEVYGEQAQAPRDATLYFRGVDALVGFITKYTTIEPYVDA